MKVGNLQLLERDEYGLLYLVMHNNHYIELVNEWRQLLHPNRFNWLTFNLFRLEIDNSLTFARYLAIHLVLLGLGLHLHLSFITNEQEKIVDQMMEDVRLEAERVEWLEEALQELWLSMNSDQRYLLSNQLKTKVEALLYEASKI